MESSKKWHIAIEVSEVSGDDIPRVRVDRLVERTRTHFDSVPSANTEITLLSEESKAAGDEARLKAAVDDGLMLAIERLVAVYRGYAQLAEWNTLDRELLDVCESWLVSVVSMLPEEKRKAILKDPAVDPVAQVHAIRALFQFNNPLMKGVFVRWQTTPDAAWKDAPQVYVELTEVVKKLLGTDDTPTTDSSAFILDSLGTKHRELVEEEERANAAEARLKRVEDLRSRMRDGGVLLFSSIDQGIPDHARKAFADMLDEALK